MKNFIMFLVVVGILAGCAPTTSNPCIDVYYDVYDETNDRDDAAQAYLDCAESRE